MSTSTRRERTQEAQSAAEDDHASGLTRRTVLAGVAATTAAVTVGVDTPAVAQSTISDLEAFIQLSAALTGIPAGKLAPATDSIGIKQEYFNWVKEKEPTAFASLLQIAKDNKDAPQAIIDRSQASDDTKFLARSIVLIWYLGSWYSPADLKRLVDDRLARVPLFVRHTVISPKAYTQGWVWRIAQAHPMGYSDMQFGLGTRSRAAGRLPLPDDTQGNLIMADDNVDVVIVGSGFAGALIANELAKKGKRVVILEAGDGIPTDINKYMERFYKAAAKVPESPYTPTLFDDDGQFSPAKNDPSKVPNGRPTVMTLGPNDWADPEKSYLVQNRTKEDGQPATPFGSTYDRIAGGTSHWLGTCLRFVPADFEMRKRYPNCPKEFVDWPIKYNDLERHYRKAEEELGVSADTGEQKYLGITFPPDYRYPMPRIPESLTDRAVRRALENLKPAETLFLGMSSPPTKIPVRSVPAARNSQPYKNRRACAGNTNCIPICPIQAKYDPTITLNEALNHKSVTMMKNTVAKEIILDGDLRRVTQIDYIDWGTGPTQKEGSIKAKIFVIAANAIETPRLLLMSQNAGRKPEGVANSSGMVGRHLMDHPYYVAWGLLPKEAKALYPYRGPLITSGIEDLCDGPFFNERGAFRVDIGNEGWNFVVAGSAAGGDPDVTTIDFVNGVNRSGVNRDGNTGVGMFGKDLIDKLNETITRQFRVGFLVEQTPDPDNRVTLSDFKDGLGLPRPKIAYSLSPYTKRGIVAAKQLQDLLFSKMGAKDITTVLPNDPTLLVEEINGKPVDLNYMGAGHIMGTYRMGPKDKPKESVVDSFQRSHDHDNLYLVGSGTFPTGATANPTLTIAALALRTAEQIANRV